MPFESLKCLTDGGSQTQIPLLSRRMVPEKKDLCYAVSRAIKSSVAAQLGHHSEAWLLCVMDSFPLW